MALPAHLPPPVRAAALEAKARLAALYGERLDRVVLYGSHARGDARPDSDVDLLVVLRGGYEPYAEPRRMGPLRLEVEIRHGVDLSCQPYAVDEVVDGRNPFMQNVAEDAIAV